MTTKVPISGATPTTPDGPTPTDEKRPSGQYKDYWVLSEEERAKGFVRPVRDSYRHVGQRPRYPTRPLTNEERELHGAANYEVFEEYPESESPVDGRFWTRAKLESGCGAITWMSLPLAETYARDPKFYGSTFCSGCSAHHPVAEFVWDGTEEPVGS